MQLIKSRQRRVCNPQLVAVWNQSEGKIHAARDAIAYGNYILAHARLHTNPSDWIEKKQVFQLAFFLGLEIKITTLQKVARRSYRS